MSCDECCVACCMCCCGPGVVDVGGGVLAGVDELNCCEAANC
ncbi:hypothetical protein ACFW04_010933 [Cataglyphis niger]